jgi:PHD/YefM family antitoxin component YafN of YafNO toxin-antitoxin module
MRTITYSEFRSELKKNFVSVLETGKPLKIETQSRDKCILLSEKKYNELIHSDIISAPIGTTAKAEKK